MPNTPSPKYQECLLSSSDVLRHTAQIQNLTDIIQKKKKKKSCTTLKGPLISLEMKLPIFISTIFPSNPPKF